MKRWWIVVVLLFSLGINVGILATLAVNKRARAGEEGPPRAAAPGRELPLGPPPEGPPPDELPRGEDGEPPVMAHLEKLADHLRLAGEDRARFLEIQRHFFVETLRHRRQAQWARRALRVELTAAEPDRERAEEILEQSTTAQAALERALVENILDSREILDPEQERIFAHFIERIARGPGEMPGPGGADDLGRRDRPGFRPGERFPNRPGLQQQPPQGQQRPPSQRPQPPPRRQQRPQDQGEKL